jgi:nucleotide-binding universal stress UspA family protein
MYRTILVGTHGSHAANQAVREAATTAARYGARLVIVSAYTPVPTARLNDELRQAPYEIAWSVQPDEDVQATLAEAAELARGAGAPMVRKMAVRTGAARAILAAAKDCYAELIVLGQGDHHRSRLLNRVSRRAPCEVQVVGGRRGPAIYAPRPLRPMGSPAAI